MTILDTILEEKKNEVSRLKKLDPTHFPERNRMLHSFYTTCRTAEEIQVIAEFKRSSPSKGEINHQLDPRTQACAYRDADAAMLSVLTDQTFFKGSMQDLLEVSETVSLPVLNKDFIIDSVQIDQAYAYGADVILLIVAALTDDKLKELHYYAESLGMEVLVEVHNEDELKRTQALSPKLIGVNNRNLKTFDVNLETTERLAQLIDTEKVVLVSESGMLTSEDVRRVEKAGARAVLVGETLMKSDNVADTIKSFAIKRGERDAG